MLTDMWFLVLMESLCHIGLSHFSHFSNWEWNTKCKIFPSLGICLTSLASMTTNVILDFPAQQQQEPWLIQGACFFPSASLNNSQLFQRMARLLFTPNLQLTASKPTIAPNEILVWIFGGDYGCTLMSSTFPWVFGAISPSDLMWPNLSW